MSGRIKSVGRATVSSVLVVLCVGALVVAQGGFFAMPSCAVGVVVCLAAGVAWIRRSNKVPGYPVVPMLFVGLLVSYLASAVVAGATFTTLATTGAWATYAGMSLLVASLNEESHASMLNAMSWMGLATAVAGVALFAFGLPLADGAAPDRLAFFFEYANGAAAWYAVCALLCLLGPSVRLRAVAFVPLAALLLTQSGGAVAALFVVAIALGVWAVRKARWERLASSLAQVLLAFLLFAAFRLLAYAGLAAMAILLVLSLRSPGWCEAGVAGLCDRAPRLSARLISLLLAAFTLVAAVVAAVLLRERISLSMASFVERTYHMRDGLTMWQMSPLLGVGPNNWQYLFPWVQTAPYVAAVVHSSFVQLLLDAGVLGGACLAAACVLGICGLRKSVKVGNDAWALLQLFAVLFLLLHSLIEFDLQFCSLACLLVALLSGPASPRVGGVAKKGANRTAVVLETRSLGMGAAGLLACLPLCVFGLLCAAGSVAMQNANSTEAYDQSVRLFQGISLARNDVDAQEKYVEALFSLGMYDQVADEYQHLPKPTNKTVLYAAIADSLQGNAGRAANTLATRLEQTPYDIELLGAACRFEERFGIDESCAERFDAAVQNSAELIEVSEVVRR